MHEYRRQPVVDDPAVRECAKAIPATSGACPAVPPRGPWWPIPRAQRSPAPPRVPLAGVHRCAAEPLARSPRAADRAPTRGREGVRPGIGPSRQATPGAGTGCRRSRGGRLRDLVRVTEIEPVGHEGERRGGAQRRRAEMTAPARPRSGEEGRAQRRGPGAYAEDQRNGRAVDARGEVREPAQRGVVAPVGVVDDQRERAALGAVHRQPVRPWTTANGCSSWATAWPRAARAGSAAPRATARGRRPTARAASARRVAAPHPSVVLLQVRAARPQRHNRTRSRRSSSVVLPIPAGPSTPRPCRGRRPHPRTPERPSPGRHRAPATKRVLRRTRAAGGPGPADLDHRHRAGSPFSSIGSSVVTLPSTYPMPSAPPSRWRVSGHPPPPHRAARPPPPAHRSSHRPRPRRRPPRPQFGR